MVSMFRDVEIRNNDKTIWSAVSAILVKRDEQHLIRNAWSLAELHLNDEDYIWLCKWAYNLHENMVKTWLEESFWRTITIQDNECSYVAAMGTLLLLFTTETARRKGIEGGLWSTFQKDCFYKATLEVLFVKGQPKRIYKDALEAAARWLQLRHVFGIEGLQSWFDTVYLQFGFSRHGFMSRLPEWLVGQGKTQAIERLLDGPMHSESFCRLWDALRNLRRNNIKIESFRAILSKNCWVLPEWIDELAIQAASRIELGRGSETDSDSTGDFYEPLFSEPILRWDGSGEPEFVCHLLNLARFELTEEIYFVLSGGYKRTRLQRNSDGIYIFHPSEEIVLPTTTPLQVMSLVSSTGSLIESAVLTLWNANDEITVFRAQSGKRIDGFVDIMRAEIAYFIITSSDLKLVPEPLTWKELDTQRTRLSMLGQNWSTTTQVQLEGQTFWQPLTTIHSNREEPKWANIVDIVYPLSKEVSFGDIIQVLVRHPRGSIISFIRLGSHPINLSEDDGENGITESITITPEMVVHSTSIASFCFTLGVRYRTLFTRISRTVTVPIVGAATVSRQGWVALNSETVMTVDEIRTLPIQIFRPNIKQYALLEGDVFIDRPHSTPRPLGTMKGLGTSVKLRCGPYNATEKDSILIREVVDRGIIHHVELDTTRTTLTMHLLWPIEPDQKHQITIWNEDATFRAYSQEDTRFTIQSSSWSLQIPVTTIRPFVIAIAYDGMRLGAWWHDEWSSLLNSNTDNAEMTAFLLRWFQLPLLNSSSIKQIKHFVSRYSSEVFPVWLADESPIQGKQWPAVDDRWLSAVRVLFKQWPARDMAVRRLVNRLGGTSKKQDEVLSGEVLLERLLINTAWRLARIDPLLMGKVVMTYLEKVYLPQFGIISTRKLLSTIISAFAGFEQNNNTILQQKKKALLEDISTSMGYLDTYFINRKLIEPAIATLQGKVLAEMDENNLALSLHIEPFRRLLSIVVLERILQIISSRR